MPEVNVRPADNDTICKIIRKSNMKCTGILYAFCNTFSAHFSIFSIYSKIPKTKSCLFVDISVQTCVVKYYLGKKNIVINCVYIVFFTMGSY